MSDPIDPSRLLKQAEGLAGVDAGPGRPSTTNHRRAVSAAYYALFHELSLAAARHVLPSGAQDQEVWGVTRWINHRDVLAICDVVAACAASSSPLVGLPKGLSRSAEPLWRALSEPQPGGLRVAKVSSQLRLVAVAFIDLHGARQSADYDHAAKFPKQTAVGFLVVASLAMTRLRNHAADEHFQRLFAWIIARASGFKQ